MWRRLQRPFFTKLKLTLIYTRDSKLDSAEKVPKTRRIRLKSNNTNFSYKVDRGVMEGGAELGFLPSAQANRLSNEGLRSN